MVDLAAEANMWDLRRSLMIGHFPDPYPEEIFYSVCARMGQRMGLKTVTGVSEALYGNGSHRTKGSKRSDIRHHRNRELGLERAADPFAPAGDAPVATTKRPNDDFEYIPAV